MVKRIIERYVSDLSGEDLPDGHSTLHFAFGGRAYEIDLTKSERDEFETLVKPYIDVARVAQPRRKSGRTTVSGPDPKVVRVWARQNGHQVPDRGRIPSPVIDAFNAAH